MSVGQKAAPAVLSSNSVPIPFSDELFAPMRDSSALLSEPDALTRRLAEDGYLLLRGVLDPEVVLALRRAYLAEFSALTTGSHTDDGSVPAHGVAGHPAHAFVRSDRFASFVEQSSLAELAETLLGGAPRRLPRAILRHFTSSSRRSSRAHTDRAYMDQGTDRVVTMWIPIGDCPLPAGGLVYLERSHTLDPARLEPLRRVNDRPQDTRPISHDLAWVARELGRRWLWTDYRSGDLAVHTPHLIHAALDTTTATDRLSVDLRYARGDDRADPRWMRPWSGDDGA